MKNLKFSQLNSAEREVVAANASLSSYLRSLEEGRPATPRSWLYEERDAKSVLDDWCAILSRIKDSEDEIYRFDLKQVEKFGPMGEIPPLMETLDILEPQFRPSEFDSWKPLIDDLGTKKIASEMFGPRLMTKRPLSFNAVVDDMRARDTLTTNSGWPDFGRRNRPEILRHAIQDAESGKAYEYPAIILFRKYYGKLRQVWMFPESCNLIENSFCQPIQEALLHSPNARVKQYVTPWLGFEYVKHEFTSAWKGSTAIGGDTTAMDAHMRKAQMCTVFNIVKWLFQKSYWDNLEESIKNVTEIDLVTSPSQKITGDHGIASGSGWTQLAETVFQLGLFITQFPAAEALGMGEGDDLVWFNTKENPDFFVSLLSEYGLPANPAKQWYKPNSCTFLQRLFLKDHWSRENPGDLGGIYPTIRALNSSLNPEKFHNPKDWNSDMFCIRQYMILENTVDHPLFEEFVSFVVKGQKDLIPFAHMSSTDLRHVQRAARLIPGLNPTYNQEKRDKPLSEFESIKFVRSHF